MRDCARSPGFEVKPMHAFVSMYQVNCLVQVALQQASARTKYLYKEAWSTYYM